LVSLTKFLFVIDRDFQKAVLDKSDYLELGLQSEECYEKPNPNTYTISINSNLSLQSGQRFRKLNQSPDITKYTLRVEFIL